MIILASKSPRRRELLRAAGFTFKVVPPEKGEVAPENAPPEETVMTLARRKAREALEKYPDGIIIGADTVVVCGGAVLGKPADKDDAFNMLKTLSGRRHYVYTGVSVTRGGIEETFYRKTEVEFFPLSDEETSAYIQTGEPFDKAGAYGIQGAGMLLVKGITGDFYNVMGLPIGVLSRKLKKFL
ncbi:MAG: Maf family protein [Oscillospiraceae bacterium]|jgi:septum formation protein|nr:Maf family protein [Oscillospiraceae bacterium]